MRRVAIVGSGNSAALIAATELSLRDTVREKVFILCGGASVPVTLRTIQNFDMGTILVMPTPAPMKYGDDRTYLRKKKGRA